MSDTDIIVREFLIESYENLDQLDQDLVELEKNPTEKRLLASIFRTIHTIKGTCGFLGYAKLESIAHVGESLLSKLRDGELAYSHDLASALLQTVDAVRQILSCIDNERNEGDVDYSSLVERLTQLQQDEGVRAMVQGDDVRPLYERIGGRSAVEETLDVFFRRVLEDERINQFFEGFDIDKLRNQQRKFINFSLGGTDPADAQAAHDAVEFLVEKDLDSDHFDMLVENIASSLEELGVPQDLVDEARVLAKSLKDEVVLKSAAVEKSDRELDPPAYDGPERRSGEEEKEETFLANQYDRRAADSSIRVDVNILDKLMNLVGELVLARNQILQVASREQDATFTATSQHLNLITTELQENVMQTRMQLIGNIWNKFPRVVRDLSMAMNKKVRLEMEGKDTELDKTLIEAIKDPLTHIVRNSVDHGIETPEERKARGKPEEGMLKLRAYHEGGQVIIEIADDGRGIDPEKIKKKAVEKGLITQDQASRMGDREAVNLIFHAGLSTAAKVTNVSGRGVGLDVVKTNIEKIGGTVDIQSQLGEGTTLKVKIPLTLAIIPALIVNCAGNRYAIPQVSLLELVRLDAESDVKVETVQGTPVYRLRGNLLPLVYLNKELETDGVQADGPVNIVVLQADDRQFGLVVDSIRDTEEIVVKPLGKQLKGITAYAGSTIMGDGKVALILDVLGLAQKAHVVTELAKERSLAEKAKEKAMKDQAEDRQALLVIGLGEMGRMAVPLESVARLEEIKLETVEVSGDQEVVQYRGEIMPLISLARFFDPTAVRKDVEVLQVVVFSHEGQSVGMVVDRIIDIVEEIVTVKSDARRRGVLGKAVVSERVTDMLDVEGIIRATLAEEEFNQPAALAASSGGE